jgi:NAD(P)-dependent dehydrogenase (short-subunit alcohol dehydrogenase family)
MRFDDPHFVAGAYDPWVAYGQSKTANVLFAVALDARERHNGIRAFSLHPGAIVETGLARHLSHEQLAAAGVFDADGRPIRDPSQQLKTVGQGAATQVWCATSRRLDGMGGLYCENVDVAAPMTASGGKMNMADARRLTGVMAYAVDEDAAGRLWALSEQLLA